jgi:hypothetical protein
VIDQKVRLALEMVVANCYGTDASMEKCGVKCFERDKNSLKLLQQGIILSKIQLQF